MRYVITIKGRRYRFATIEAASAKASAIFTATGIVVGIERE
jgi:hypothetical protein